MSQNTDIAIIMAINTILKIRFITPILDNMKYCYLNEENLLPINILRVEI